MQTRLILDSEKYAELGSELIAAEIGQMTEAAKVELLDDGRIAVEYDPTDMDELFLKLPRHLRELDRALEEKRAASTPLDEKRPSRQTVVVNIFGGPGAGKTTAAHEIVAALSKRGYVVEYAPEYAKELAWAIGNENCTQEEQRAARAMLDGTLRNQSKIYEEQRRRVDVLVGKCDFVVTDSPTILSCIYLEDEEEAEAAEKFREAALKDFKLRNNFNMVVKREGAYQEQGRIHTEEQAKQLDARIESYLETNGIYHGAYRRTAMATALYNMEKNLAKVRKASRRPFFPDPANLRKAPGKNNAWTASTPAADVTLSYHGDDGWACLARAAHGGLSKITLAGTAIDAFEGTRIALGRALAQDDRGVPRVTLPIPKLADEARKRLEQLQDRAAKDRAPRAKDTAAAKVAQRPAGVRAKDRSR